MTGLQLFTGCVHCAQQYGLHAASNRLHEVVHACGLAALRALTPVQIARGFIAEEPYVLDMLQLGAHLGAFTQRAVDPLQSSICMPRSPEEVLLLGTAAERQ